VVYHGGAQTERDDLAPSLPTVWASLSHTSGVREKCALFSFYARAHRAPHAVSRAHKEASACAISKETKTT